MGAAAGTLHRLMFNGFNLPAPDWRVAAAPPAPPRGGWGCACATCRPPVALRDPEVLDAAELFRRHPLAHLEVG